MPFRFINSANSWEVNWGRLSLTSCYGFPYRANISRSFSIVASLVLLGMSSTSSHFELLSITSKNILPMNGPAKSICSLCHGALGQAHEYNGDYVGRLRVDWQFEQLRTTCATDSSTCGHHTWSLASDFMRTTTGDLRVILSTLVRENT